MQNAGWIVRDIIAMVPMKMKVKEIGIEIRNGDNPPAAALQQALNLENIPVEFFMNSERENDEVLLVIGEKH